MMKMMMMMMMMMMMSTVGLINYLYFQLSVSNGKMLSSEPVEGYISLSCIIHELEICSKYLYNTIIVGMKW